MTQTEFVNRWKDYLLGIATYGYAVDACDGPLSKAEQGSHVRRSIDKTEKLLADMWHSMQPEPKPLETKTTPPVAPNPPGKSPPPPVGTQAPQQGSRR